MNKRQQLKIISSVLGVIGLILILWIGWIWSKQHRFSIYKNSSFGFSIKYPANWILREDVPGVVVGFISPPESAIDIYQENFNIVIQDLTGKDTDIKNYTETAIKQLEAVFGENIKILESKPIFLFGKFGYKLVYLGRAPEAELKWMHQWVIVGPRAIQFTYSALSSSYDRYIDKAEKMISSFQLK